MNIYLSAYWWILKHPYLLIFSLIRSLIAFAFLLLSFAVFYYGRPYIINNYFLAVFLLFFLLIFASIIFILLRLIFLIQTEYELSIIENQQNILRSIKEVVSSLKNILYFEWLSWVFRFMYRTNKSYYGGYFFRSLRRIIEAEEIVGSFTHDYIKTKLLITWEPLVTLTPLIIIREKTNSQEAFVKAYQRLTATFGHHIVKETNFFPFIILIILIIITKTLSPFLFFTFCWLTLADFFIIAPTTIIDGALYRFTINNVPSPFTITQINSSYTCYK